MHVFASEWSQGSTSGQSGTLTVRGSAGEIEVALDCCLQDSCLRCVLSLANHSNQCIQIGDVDVLFLDRAAGSASHLLADAIHVFSLGAVTGESELTWSPERSNKKVFALLLNQHEQHYASDNVFCARPVDRQDLTPEVTFSFDRIGDAACGVVVDLESGRSRARVAFRGASLPPGSQRHLPALFVDGISPVNKAIDAAVDRVAAIYNPPRSGKIPSGWCSWYYYYESITERAIIDNLRFLADRREQIPVDYIQIDDGYQRHWGDWLLPSGKFPHDMAWLSREIKGLGFRPGIWVAPLIMSVQSDLYRAHPEWALKRFDSEASYQVKGWSPKEESPWVVLDGTHPEVLRHLKEMFFVMAHEWGYDYFKLDAMAMGGFAGIRYRPELTGEQTLRLVLEAIREAIGPDKFILGCGVPFGSAVGVVNGVRVSDDVSTAFRREDFWCPMEVSLPQSIHRSFIHNKWWFNDPDCVLVRSEGTPHKERLAEVGLSKDEARFFVAVIGLTQGIQMLGENMPRLDADRLALLEMIQPTMPCPARPLDLFASQPERLLTTLPHGHVLGLFNWGRESKRLCVAMSELGLDSGHSYGIYELWSGDRITATDRFEIEIPSQGCKLLCVRSAVHRPMFIGFDGHISCGASLLERESWNPETQTLDLVFSANRPGMLSIVAPAGWIADTAVLNPRGPSAWSVPLGKGRHSLSYQFRELIDQQI